MAIFEKDEKFYVNYSEIAMELISKGKNFKMFENITKNPIFPSATLLTDKIKEKYPEFSPLKSEKPSLLSLFVLNKNFS